jgi:transposase-like protein
VKETWVLGMIDVTTRESVIRYVKKRDAATMIPIIQQHVKPGTTIWSDCWRAYNGLKDLGYIHGTVNHSKNFKSAAGVCTNLIEGHWKCLKQYCRMKNVLQSKFLFEYVDEFRWSNIYGKDVSSKFTNLLAQIKERYPICK